MAVAEFADAAPAVDATAARDAGTEVRRDATTVLPRDDGPTRLPSFEPCWNGRWCWVEGAPVRTLDGGSADTIYATDEGGRLWHWNGADWEAVAGLDGRRAIRVYVAAADELWIVAEHQNEEGFFVDRFDGAGWTTMRRDVDPRALLGFGRDNVWARDRESLDWLRFDGRAWHAVQMPDPERFDIPHDSLYSKLMPGPAPEAYAITVTRIDPSATPPQRQEVAVMRFDGTTWARMGAIETGWASLAWSDGEPRVVEHRDEGSAELRFDGERWVRVQWVPTDRAPDGFWLTGTARGVAYVPHGRSCLDVLPMGEELFCTTLARGGVRGLTIARVGPGRSWTDTVFPGATRPLAPELFADVAPGYWALGSVRSWADGPSNVLRVRGATDDGFAFRLVHLDGVHETIVLDADDQPIAAAQIDGVARERPWVAGDGLFRVRGARAERLAMPPDAEWTRPYAIAAAPGDRAWALAGTFDTGHVLRADGDVVAVDHELPLFESTTEHVRLHDIAVTPTGDVWVLATVGARSGHGMLLHRSAGARGGPVWRRVQLWDEAFGARQLVYYRDALYIWGVTGAHHGSSGGWFGGSSVARLPLDALTGDAVTTPASDFVLDRAPDVLADGQLASTDPGLDFSFSEAELWVGDSGVWLTTQSGARRFVEPR